MQSDLVEETPETFLADVSLRRGAEGSLECVLPLILEQPVDAVWQALTASPALPHWLAPGEIEPRLGGSVRIAFEVSGAAIESEVAAWVPGERLAYSWSSPGQPRRPVEWRLASSEVGVDLRLRLEVPAEDDAARAFAGWSAHLQMLGAYLAGAPIGFPVPHFQEARSVLGARLAEL